MKKPVIARDDFSNFYGVIERIPFGSSDGCFEIGKKDSGEWAIAEGRWTKNYPREYFPESDAIHKGLQSKQEAQNLVNDMLSQI